MNKIVEIRKIGDEMVVVVEAGAKQKRYGHDLLQFTIHSLSRVSVQHRPNKDMRPGREIPLFDPRTKSFVLETEAAELSFFQILLQEAELLGLNQAVLYTLVQEMIGTEPIKADQEPGLDSLMRIPSNATKYGKGWAFIPAERQ